MDIFDSLPWIKNNSMKNILVSLILSIFLCTLKAQNGGDDIIPSNELDTLIDSIAKVVAHNYIQLEMGEKMSTFILEQHQQKAYNKLSYIELCRQLRKDFVEVSDDVHMNALYWKHAETPQLSKLEELQDPAGAKSNYGYVEIKITRENIGYLKIAHFTKWKFFSKAKTAATNAIRILQNTDALVIDLRDNPGGFEDIVAHVLSHFFDGPKRELQSYHIRNENRKRSIYITEELPIKKLPEIPIYILINEGTGSAAESFSYMMKHLGRATVLGDTTVGAGNGSRYYRISDKIVVQVATSETINAVTKTSWEKVGVAPNIVLDSAVVEAKAFEMAEKAGKLYREKMNQQLDLKLNHFYSALENYSPKTPDTTLVQALMECEAIGFYNEGSINSLGYEYLGQKQKPATAVAIFRANTLLYPNSANVYDSYAEALAAIGKYKLAISNYEKAVELGKANEDPTLNIFIENLAKAKSEWDDKE